MSMLVKLLEIFLLVVIPPFSVPNTLTPNSTPQPEVLSQQINLDIVGLTNNQRVVKLKYSTKLYSSAQKRACDMNKSRQWSHDGAANYLKGKGYTFVGENIARYFTNDEQVFNAWITSPSHKSVMLNSRYKYVGIGKCGDYTVAHFGGW